MLKEITHTKAIETLKSGGEIVIKRNIEPDIRYKITDNCLMWATENIMWATESKWNSIVIRTLADFLLYPVYIEAKPFSMSFECDPEPEQSLWYLLYTTGKIDWFDCDVNYQIKISKQTYKPIGWGQVVSNYHYKKPVAISSHMYPADIKPFVLNDDFKISQLKEHNWFEQKTTTEVHERKFHEFTGFYPGNFCSGKCTITITELEK